MSIYSELRLVVLWPALITFGLAWFGIFYARWRQRRCLGDLWAAHSGLASAIMGGISIIGLWIVRSDGPSPFTSMTFTLGLGIYVIFQIAGIIMVARRLGRNGDDNNAGRK